MLYKRQRLPCGLWFWLLFTGPVAPSRWAVGCPCSFSFALASKVCCSLCQAALARNHHQSHAWASLERSPLASSSEFSHLSPPQGNLTSILLTFLLDTGSAQWTSSQAVLLACWWTSPYSLMWSRSSRQVSWTDLRSRVWCLWHRSVDFYLVWSRTRCQMGTIFYPNFIKISCFVLFCLLYFSIALILLEHYCYLRNKIQRRFLLVFQWWDSFGCQ